MIDDKEKHTQIKYACKILCKQILLGQILVKQCTDSSYLQYHTPYKTITQHQYSGTFSGNTISVHPTEFKYYSYIYIFYFFLKKIYTLYKEIQY